MSIVAAKKAYQDGLGNLGTVLSGTMRYDTSAKEEVYTFKVSIPGETDPREFLVRVAEGVKWQTYLPERGRKAADLLRSKTKGAAA